MKIELYICSRRYFPFILRSKSFWRLFCDFQLSLLSFCERTHLQRGIWNEVPAYHMMRTVDQRTLKFVAFEAVSAIPQDFVAVPVAKGFTSELMCKRRMSRLTQSSMAWGPNAVVKHGRAQMAHQCVFAYLLVPVHSFPETNTSSASSFRVYSSSGPHRNLHFLVSPQVVPDKSSRIPKGLTK